MSLKKTLIFVGLITLFLSCKTEKEIPFKSSIFKSSIDINHKEDIVTFHCEIISESNSIIDSVGFIWGDTKYPSFLNDSFMIEKYTGDTFSTSTPLHEMKGKEIYYYSFGKTKGIINYSSIKSFKLN